MSPARRRSSRTLLEVATSYVDWLWSSGAPPNTKKGAVTSLAATVPLFVRQLDHAPEAVALQWLLSTLVLPPPRRTNAMTAEYAAAVAWLRRASRPVTDLADDIAASELLIALGKTTSGRPVTSLTWDKRRAVLHRTLEFARSSGWISPTR